MKDDSSRRPEGLFAHSSPPAAQWKGIILRLKWRSQVYIQQVVASTHQLEVARCPHLPTAVSLHNTSYTHYIDSLICSTGAILAIRTPACIAPPEITRSSVPIREHLSRTPSTAQLHHRGDDNEKANQTHQSRVRNFHGHPFIDLSQEHQAGRKRYGLLLVLSSPSRTRASVAIASLSCWEASSSYSFFPSDDLPPSV